MSFTLLEVFYLMILAPAIFLFLGLLWEGIYGKTDAKYYAQGIAKVLGVILVLAFIGFYFIRY